MESPRQVTADALSVSEPVTLFSMAGLAGTFDVDPTAPRILAAVSEARRRVAAALGPELARAVEEAAAGQ
ncbi:MAG: hypothetical protein JNL98_35450 [Bryobacterales bacterium]|nr:hypothetical protein [Bryobacterales bacterium]